MTLKPPRPNLVREIAGLRHLARLPLKRRSLRPAAPGAAPVLVLPGFMAGDSVMWPLRRTLRSLGYRVHGWGLGLNHGDIPRILPPLTARLLEVSAKGPVHIVGWSLGGYLAREIARDAPDSVIQVITMASPVIGGPKYSLAAPYYKGRGFDLDAMERQIAQRDREAPLRVPVTALYSPTDQVVDPRACIDRVNSHVAHIPVLCSHTAFGFSPDVFAIVADRLAMPLPDTLRS